MLKHAFSYLKNHKEEEREKKTAIILKKKKEIRPKLLFEERLETLAASPSFSLFSPSEI
jgi:hypothetical protein